MSTLASLPYLVVILLAFYTQDLVAQRQISPDDVRECDPVLTVTGNTLYFTRPDHARNQGVEDHADVWFRTRAADGKWGAALNPGSPVNSFGEDRLLSCSVDGNRLAVLRCGDRRRIDLLEREGRNWRVLESWSLPREATDLEELTFNATGQELVYSRPSDDGGSRNLYLRRAVSDGSWEAEQPLSFLNSFDHESKPQFAADGRTLYFRRGAGHWFRQSDRGKAPVAVDIPSRYLQLAATDELLVATSDDLGQDERLLTDGLSPAVLCPPGRVSYGTLGSPPPAGKPTISVPLSSGTSLRVRPDVLRRYAVVVRDDEVAFPKSNVPTVDRSRPAGSLASLGEIATQTREAYLQRALTERQRELRRMDEFRRRRYTAPTDAFSPQGYESSDTLPPGDSTGTYRDRYARELTELERMKEKFRRQQEERYRERQRGSYLDLEWNEPAAPAPDSASSVDTKDLESRVRSGLYPNQREPATARRPWEYDVGATPPKPLDAAYDRELRELEALRAQLREVTGTTTDGRDLTTKGDVEYPPAGTRLPSAGVSVAGVAFIPHTAYPNSAGYEALDVLSDRIRKAAVVIEIRVHTAPDLNPREAQLLSEERAVTIREYLVDAGNNPANFRVVGYGNHQPEGGERVEVIE